VSVRVFRRQPRTPLPDVPQGEVILQPPPGLPGPGNNSQAMMQMMFMLPMMLGMGAMSFTYIGRSGGAMTMVFGVLYVGMLVGMMVMMLGRSGGAKKSEINGERRDYLRYLANTRKDVQETALAQRAALLAAHPTPEGLATVASGDRLWERQQFDRDSFHMRIGTGPQRLGTELLSPQTMPLEDLDPVSSTSLRHFMRTYATVPDLPVAVALRAFPQIVVHGERPVALDLVRACLANLATLHGPDELRIAVCAAPGREADWDWLKWLPHVHHASRADATGPLRLLAPSLSELADLLEPDLGDRPRFSRNPIPGVSQARLVIVLDQPGLRHGGALAPEGGLHGVTLWDVTGTLPLPLGHTELRLIAEGERLGMVTADGVEFVGAPDRMDAVAAQTLARRIGSVRIPRVSTGGGSSLTANVGLPELLGMGDPRSLDTAQTWRPRSRRDRLRIPLGLDPGGLPVELDLKESAEGGMGPHGLIIGATGSGKSELLRTLTVGLAATHSSETLNFALVDFKGGATFAGLGALPHTCAVITNLADDLALVDRMREALHGELIRRQELLKAAGNYASARDYERAREAGADLAPLPTLLVIIDEFSELLSSKPDFIEVFVMIGRLGRSLGVHLLLASQRLDEGRLRGLDSHLSYRIGLRTFSASESRSVLGVPDAYELPPVPGSAYLKIDTETMIRFKAAYVSGILPPEEGIAVRPTTSVVHRVVPFAVASTSPEVVADDAEPETEDSDDRDTSPFGESMMDAMVRRVEGQGPPAHAVWLPPLGESPSLDRLLPPLGSDPQRGLCPAGWPGNGRLVVPFGVVDKPFEQVRDVLRADLSGATGNVMVVGGPQSGKSTTLRTLVCSLALTHTPSEVQVFCLDFGGGALTALADLPHVGGVGDRQEEERCRRIVATLTKLLVDRETRFRAEGLDSMEAFRRKYAGRGDDQGFGDVFLVVDNWLTLKQDFEALEEQITMLGNRGLSYGIHVLASANRWWDIRLQTRDVFGTRLELRMGEPNDSEIDRRAAANVPAGAPGRGLTADGRQCLVALPRIDGQSDATSLTDGVASLIQAVSSQARSEAPRLSLLPQRFELQSLPNDGEPLAVPFALGESDLAPVSLDFTVDPHLVVFGDVECGKTNLLRVVMQQLVARNTPDQVRLIVADYRRQLIDAAEGEHLLAYAGSQKALAAAVAEASVALRTRLPGPEVTAEQLRNRSWWTGPRLFVVVDDYELVSAASQNPLEPLVELLGQARDIHLHLVVARRAGGAGRALFDPILGRLRELSSPGLVMSGTRDEGALVGDVKAGPQPPGRGVLVRRREGTELVQIATAPVVE
jgi:DNA segregation ATPase FtsK/SpoIIIE, S-DNA-T family